MKLTPSETKFLVWLLDREHERLARPYGQQVEYDKNGRFKYIRTLISKLNKQNVEL